MKIAALACLLASASAFAPAQQGQSAPALKSSSATEFDSMIGISNEVGNKFFDPVGLSQWAPAEHLRKAELSNGRFAMLAVVGWEFPKIYMFNSDDVQSPDAMKAILDADPQWWAQFIIFCGTIEAVKYRGELEGKSYTGDGPAVIDWTNTWETLDEKQKEDMRLKELKNARLAMLAIASFVSNYYIPGSVPLLPEGF